MDINWVLFFRGILWGFPVGFVFFYLYRVFGKYGFTLLQLKGSVWYLLAGFVIGICLSGGAVHWLAVARDNATREFLRLEGVPER